MMKKRMENDRLPKDLRNTIRNVLGIQEKKNVTKQISLSRKRKKCDLCDKKKTKKEINFSQNVIEHNVESIKKYCALLVFVI